MATRKPAAKKSWGEGKHSCGAEARIRALVVSRVFANPTARTSVKKSRGSDKKLRFEGITVLTLQEKK